MKLLEPLGIKAPLLPARIIGQNCLQTQIVPIELVAAEIRGNMAIAAFAESQERTGDVEVELELPQLPQVLQNLAILSPLVLESAAQENLAPTGQKTVKIASSDRLTFAPITVSSNHQKTKPNLKPSTPTTATPEAWSSITDLLANVDSADIGNVDHVIGQPPIKTIINHLQQTTSPQRSSQKPDRRNLELLAQEIYAFIQQQLLIEREFHSQSSSGRLPW